MVEIDGGKGKDNEDNSMENSWVITDGEAVDDDWDHCLDALTMVQKQREIERGERKMFNERVRQGMVQRHQEIEEEEKRNFERIRQGWEGDTSGKGLKYYLGRD